jgi:hypothetical protein
MIVDGENVFRAQDIGDNWPALQMKDDDPDRMVICVCGKRAQMRAFGTFLKCSDV